MMACNNDACGVSPRYLHIQHTSSANEILVGLIRAGKQLNNSRHDIVIALLTVNTFLHHGSGMYHATSI